MRRAILLKSILIAATILFVLSACSDRAHSAPLPSASEPAMVSISPSPSPVVSLTPSPSPNTSPSAAPSKTPVQTPMQTTQKPLTGLVIGIDPGHQAHSNSGTEPLSPGSKTMKKKVSSGTAGRYSRVAEYKVNLQVGLKLQKRLEDLGATVVMTRTKNDVNLSNVQRAKLFNEKKTDFAIRLHCNGSNKKEVHGAFILIPKTNPYLSDCKLAAKCVLDAFIKETGAKDLGITPRSDQTGFNWCTRMIINIEMGHMTNKEEDLNLTNDSYQDKMAKGIANGIVEYFKHNK